MHSFGCHGFDDIDAVTKGSEPMTQNPLKGLVTEEHSSGYNARYRPAVFEAKEGNNITSNIELVNENAMHSLGHRIPRLRDMIRGNTTELKRMAQDERAILRRITLLHLDESMAPPMSADIPTLEDVMTERLQNLV